MQHSYESNGDQNGKKSSLKDNFQSNKNGKTERKTTFATIPNQRTWQQTATSSANQEADDNEASGITSDNADAMQPVVSELTQIRLKLEEKRKMIEKKKIRNEVQQQKVRQRLGKTVFLNVVTKPHAEETVQNGDSDGQDGRDVGRFGDVSNRLAADDAESNNQAAGRSARAFSREGIQQTIENVRKKWFKDDENTAGVVHDENSDGRKQRQMVESTPILRSEQKRTSPPGAGSGGSMQRDLTQTGMQRSYDERLDHLNQSLNTLQGEIQQLSLNSAKELQTMNTAEREAIDQTNKVASPNVGTVSGVSIHDRGPYHMPVTQQAHYHGVVSGHQPVLTGLHQYNVVSTGTAVPGGLIPNTQTGQIYPSPQLGPSQPFLQSTPTVAYPTQPQHSPYGISPMSTAYNVGISPQQFPPSPHGPSLPVTVLHSSPPSAVNAMTPASHVYHSPLPSTLGMTPPSHTGAQVFHPSSAGATVPQHVNMTPPRSSAIETFSLHQNNNRNLPVSDYSSEVRSAIRDNRPLETHGKQTLSGAIDSSANAFDDGSLNRSKAPSVKDKLYSVMDTLPTATSQSQNLHPAEKQTTQNPVPSSQKPVQTGIQPSPYKDEPVVHAAEPSGVHNADHSGDLADVNISDVSGNAPALDTSDQHGNVSGVGFVIGQEEESLTQVRILIFVGEIVKQF